MFVAELDNAKYVIGWKRMMHLILCVFEDNKRMEEIQKTLHKLLEDWSKDNWMGRGIEIIVDSKITEEIFSRSILNRLKIPENGEGPLWLMDRRHPAKKLGQHGQRPALSAMVTCDGGR